VLRPEASSDAQKGKLCRKRQELQHFSTEFLYSNSFDAPILPGGLSATLPHADGRSDCLQAQSGQTSMMMGRIMGLRRVFLNRKLLSSPFTALLMLAQSVLRRVSHS
jgi:hypothetical protein